MEKFPKEVQEKLDGFVTLCSPKNVVICDGTKDEYQHFLDVMVDKKVAKPLKNQGCYYFRSDPKDVARVESCTFICTE